MAPRTPVPSLFIEAVKAPASARELRKAKILQAVVEILSAEGLDELTLERIGTRVGMARSHVVYYFPDREALVEAAIRFAALSADRVISAHLAQARDSEAMLRQYVAGNFAWLRASPQHTTVYTLLYYLASFRPKYRKLHGEIREKGAQRIEVILAGRSAVNATAPTQRRRTAKAIQAVITGVLIELATTPPEESWEISLRRTTEWVERLAGRN